MDLLIGYDYQLKNTGDYNSTVKIKMDTYTIKATIVNQTYILEVLHLEHNIYVVQFYLKNHKLSENRFSLLLPSEIKGNNTHVFYLLNTIINLCGTIYLKDNHASFGFMGAPTTKENNYKKNTSNINPDRTVRNTKRFRVYSNFVRRYFSPNDFSHISFKDASCFLLKNNNNNRLDEIIATDYLNEIIDKKIAVN